MLVHPSTGQAFDSPVGPVPDGRGDPATPQTPVAGDAARGRPAGGYAGSIPNSTRSISVCRACPRLVSWREEVAVVKRRAFADQPYWGRPVPGWGSERPRLLIVGLAPAAHGADRTGRMFTGDRSGDQLYAALHRAGLVNSPISVDAGDGFGQPDSDRRAGTVRASGQRPDAGGAGDLLALAGRRMAAGARPCAGDRCPGRVRLAGRVATAGRGRNPPTRGSATARSRNCRSGVRLLGCYHPSQQNMFTGRLTPVMLDDIFTTRRSRQGLSD